MGAFRTYLQLGGTHSHVPFDFEFVRSIGGWASRAERGRLARSANRPGSGWWKRRRAASI